MYTYYLITNLISITSILVSFSKSFDDFRLGEKTETACYI